MTSQQEIRRSVVASSVRGRVKTWGGERQDITRLKSTSSYSRLISITIESIYHRWLCMWWDYISSNRRLFRSSIFRQEDCFISYCITIDIPFDNAVNFVGYATETKLSKNLNFPLFFRVDFDVFRNQMPLNLRVRSVTSRIK